MRYLLDTDILIEVLRNNKQVAEQLKSLQRSGDAVCYSPITKAEIHHGLRDGEETRTARLFEAMECLNIDDATGEKAGEYLRTFRKSHGLELADALIAASAFQEQATFITFNRRHYPMTDIQFRDLTRENS